MSTPKPVETFDELVTRLAYNIVVGVARGETAERMAHRCAEQTLMWRADRDKQQGGTPE